jgi:hypothetical protein
MTGAWVLHFNWGTGSYSQANITFNADGTFAGPGNGKWRQRDGTLQLSFDGGPAKYGGAIDGNVGTGAMSTFAGLNGYWYLVKQGTVGVKPEAAAAAYDASGKALQAKKGEGR